jgi:hypothetical protein
MLLPFWLKIGWTLWLAIWAPLYWKEYGAQNFLFFCDIGNIFIGVALWAESALLFSWVAVGVLLFQALYVFDLFGAVLARRHFIGGTEYMFDPHVSLLLRLLSLFHVFTPPLLLWAIRRLGYDSRAWKLQTITCWTMVTINYFWRPEYDVNFARGLFFHQQHTVPGPVYLAAYFAVVPLVIYLPTHLFLNRWSNRGQPPPDVR